MCSAWATSRPPGSVTAVEKSRLEFRICEYEVRSSTSPISWTIASSRSPTTDTVTGSTMPTPLRPESVAHRRQRGNRRSALTLGARAGTLAGLALGLHVARAGERRDAGIGAHPRVDGEP